MKRFLSHWSNFIILIIFLVYFPALFTFFSQDDFTHLMLAQAKNLQEVIGFFNFKTSGIYYRPLSVQLITFGVRSFFGLQPFWFHLIALGFHLGATLVVKKIIDKLTGNKDLGLWGAVFYGVNPVHFMSLFWWAELSMVMAPLFSFLAILAWLEGKYGKFSLWLLLALLSNELAISVIPIVLLLKPAWKKLIPMGLIGLVIVGGRWLIAPPALGTEYGMKFLPQVAVSNWRWQIIRALGFPEGFAGQLALNTTKLAIVGMSLSSVLLITMAVKSKKLTRRFWVGGSWFGLALLPVLFLEHHQSPIYGIIGLPGFFLMLADFLEHRSQKWVYVWGGLFILGSLLGVRAMEQYHWVTQRAREAKYYMHELQTKQVKNSDTVVFLNSRPESSTNAYLALGAGNGVKVFFGKETKVYFEDLEVPNLDNGVKIHYVVSDFSF